VYPTARQPVAKQAEGAVSKGKPIRKVGTQSFRSNGLTAQDSGAAVTMLARGFVKEAIAHDRFAAPFQSVLDLIAEGLCSSNSGFTRGSGE
jgi:hypothetical protein